MRKIKIVFIGDKWISAEHLNGKLYPKIEVISLPEHYPVQNLDYIGDFDLLIFNLTCTCMEAMSKLEHIRHTYIRLPLLVAVEEQAKAIDLFPLNNIGITDYIFSSFDAETVETVINIHLEQRSGHPFWPRWMPGNGQLNFVAPAFREMAGVSPILPNETAAMQVRFFGPLQLQYQGQIINLPKGNKLRSILANLLYEVPKKVSRHQLLQRFWSDIDTASASNNLSVNLCNLRKYLKTALQNSIPLLHCDQERCYITPELSLKSDVEVFNGLYYKAREYKKNQCPAEAVACLLKAVDLYRADFLDDLREESWVIFIRETLLERYIGMLEYIAQWQLEQYEYGEAVETLRRILQKDDCAERVHRQLIDCLLQSGKAEAALRQYRECQRILLEKMRRKPEVATQDLVKAWA
jgi:SARP family transcriptional regulator, regulator of embCAB operon